MKARLTLGEHEQLRDLLALAHKQIDVLNDLERTIALTVGLISDPTGVVTDAVTMGWSLEQLLHELDIPLEPSEADAS